MTEHRRADPASAEEVAELRARLLEAEETLDAIRNGSIDALLVKQPGGPGKIFTLVSADRPYRSLIEQMTEGAVTLSHEGVILYGNSRLGEILGQPMEKVAGNHLRRFFTATEWERFEAFLAAPRTGAARGEFAATRPDGAVVPIYVSISDIVPDEGAPPLIGGVISDLTAQHELEARFREAQKMEAVGQLTGGLAHDFNNLLQAIRGNLELIKFHPEDLANVRKWADNGTRAAERGSRLTAQLLAFSGSQRMDLKPVDLAGVLRGMADLLRGAVGSEVDIQLDLAARLPLVLTDKTQLELAVLNLAINARDAMREGGRLTLATQLRAVDGDAELETGNYVELRVTDSGCGMAERVRSRAFDPFFTTKAIGAGTGLGLAQVYGIARQAGGTARITSGVGTGTTVTLLLRQAAVLSPPAEAVPETLGAAVAPVHPSPSVLVVDDDDEVRAVLVECLGLLGYTVAQAGSASSGLEMMALRRPDVVVTDFAMPKMNGAEMVKRAAALGFDMPVIFVSGYSDTAAVHDAVGPGANLLGKPFSMAVLAKEIERVVLQRSRVEGSVP